MQRHLREGGVHTCISERFIGACSGRQAAWCSTQRLRYTWLLWRMVDALVSREELQPCRMLHGSIIYRRWLYTGLVPGGG